MIKHTLRAAAFALAALFVFAFPPQSKAIDLTVDLGSFSPMQAQGLRDTYMSKKAGECINLPITSMLTSRTPTAVIPWTGTVVHAYTSLHGAILTDATVTFLNNSTSTSMGSLTIAASGSALGTIDEVATLSNATVTAEGFIAAYSNGGQADVAATATICIRPSDGTIGRP